LRRHKERAEIATDGRSHADESCLLGCTYDSFRVPIRRKYWRCVTWAFSLKKIDKAIVTEYK